MLELYLIRHGECKGNREGLFRGRHDFPLNENGIRQARALREALKSVDLRAIYTSPLSRAWETAEILADGRIPVYREEGLTNIALGEWENQPKQVIKERFPDLWQLWITEPEKLQFPGMETLAEVQARAYGSIQRMIESHPQGAVAVVTHRAVIKPLMAALLQVQPPYFWKFHMDTAAFSIVEFRPERGFTVTLFNETHHLKDFIREDLG